MMSLSMLRFTMMLQAMKYYNFILHIGIILAILNVVELQIGRVLDRGRVTTAVRTTIARRIHGVVVRDVVDVGGRIVQRRVKVDEDLIIQEVAIFHST